MAYLLVTFTAALAFGTSHGMDMPMNSSSDSTVGCTTTQINATDKQEDFAWVLKGLKNLANQIGWAGLAEGSLTLETSMYSQKTMGQWSMKVGSFPGRGKMYLCLNFTPEFSSEQLKIISIRAAIASGNDSVLLKSPQKGPRHHPRGPHSPHPHGPPQSQPPPPPHHPPHGPPHHPPHGPPHGPPHHPPHDPPHGPPHGPPHHPPAEPPHMIPPPSCQHIWTICPKQLEATFPSNDIKDSNDDIAIVFGIKAVFIHTEQTSSQGCQVPRFQDIASTDKPQDEEDDGDDNEDEDGMVVNTGTTDMPRETSSSDIQTSSGSDFMGSSSAPSTPAPMP